MHKCLMSTYHVHIYMKIVSVIYIYNYIYIHARGAKFSDTSCLWVIGHVENCVFPEVTCTFLSIVICLDNLMFDGRFFFRPFKFKYKKYSSLVLLSWNCQFFLFLCFNIFIYIYIYMCMKKVQN